MFSSWTERQGQVGDLRNQSKEELQELLLRQEKILSNKRLLSTLPDRGKKIQDFTEKVRFAIDQHNEEEKRQSLVSAARTELQSKYQQAFAFRQHALSTTPASSNGKGGKEDAAGGAVQDRDTSPVSAHVQEDATLGKQQVSSRVAAVDAAGTFLNFNEVKEGELVEAMKMVRLSEASAGEFKDQLNCRTEQNYFLRKHPPKKPHYLSVLEKTEASAAPMKQKFKPNQLLHRNDISPSGSSSPGSTSKGAPPLSTQARRDQERKHLDDITAAKLPPLHHNPAQLLSLEESASLLKEQTKKQQELQGKLGAQKLSEGLKISMGSYIPEAGPMAAYREIHDEGAQFSSEED